MVGSHKGRRRQPLGGAWRQRGALWAPALVRPLVAAVGAGAEEERPAPRSPKARAAPLRRAGERGDSGSLCASEQTHHSRVVLRQENLPLPLLFLATLPSSKQSSPLLATKKEKKRRGGSSPRTPLAAFLQRRLFYKDTPRSGHDLKAPKVVSSRCQTRWAFILRRNGKNILLQSTLKQASNFDFFPL